MVFGEDFGRNLGVALAPFLVIGLVAAAAHRSGRRVRVNADATLAPARTITALDGYSAGLSATSAAGDVLVSAVVGETQPRVVVTVLDRDGVTRGEAIEVGRSNDPRWMRGFTRIVTTPGGALVAFGGETRNVSAAPLRCEP